ncbi:MAG: hypothetical protein ABSD98_10425 [Candidatus Korobacteraceae bacterium]
MCRSGASEKKQQPQPDLSPQQIAAFTQAVAEYIRARRTHRFGHDYC